MNSPPPDTSHVDPTTTPIQWLQRCALPSTFPGFFLFINTSAGLRSTSRLLEYTRHISRRRDVAQSWMLHPRRYCKLYMAGDSTERSALVESKAAGTFQDNAYRNPTTEDTSSERTRTKYTESTERLDERSPLLSAQDLEDNVASLHGDLSSSHILELHDGETQKSKSTWYLFILTLSIGG